MTKPTFHLTPELWDRFMSGALTGEDRAQLLEHLASPCPECEDLLLALGVDEVEAGLAARWTRVASRREIPELDDTDAEAMLDRVLARTRTGGKAMSEPRIPNRIAELLAERERLETALQDELMRPLAIMFTDIKGSTSFFEKRGDLAGLMMVEKHNNLLFPIIRSHGGTVVKTIGDAIMARFPDAGRAAAASILMQQALKKYNEAAPAADAIHVRIGINWGRGMVKDNDVFGDVVNVAARVESCCEPDQILLSESVYRELAGSSDFQIQPYKREIVRGKADAIEIYRIFWDESEVSKLNEEPATVAAEVVRGSEAVPAAAPAPAPQPAEDLVLHFSATLVEDRIQASLSESRPGEESAVRESEDIKVNMAEINEQADAIYTLLKRSTATGESREALLAGLRSTGRQLFDRLFPAAFRERLRQSRRDDLVIAIDDRLVHIPWELCHDGQAFLCRRFNLGRVVSTHQQVKEQNRRRLRPPLKMLALSTHDPKLKGAEEESRRMVDQISDLRAPVELRLALGGKKPQELLRELSSYDIIHYSGHSVYTAKDPASSGWILDKDSSIDARSVVEAPGPMPALVFSNSCQSGKTAPWRGPADFNRMTFSLANAFLLNGVRHFIGSFHDLSDRRSANMASAFYRYLFSGNSIGQALRMARDKFVADFGEGDLTWASYVLYGDPTTVYLPAVEAGPNRGELHVQTVRPKSGKGWIVAAIALAVIAVILVALLVGRLGDRSDRLQPLTALVESGQFGAAVEQAGKMGDNPGALLVAAVASLENNDPAAARQFRERIKSGASGDAGVKLLAAEEALNNGETDVAGKLLSELTAAPKPWPWLQARALNLQGRLAEAEGRDGDARGLYESALAIEPNLFPALVNLGLLLENEGNFAAAEKLFARAKKLRPSDEMLLAIVKDNGERDAWRQDPANRQRVLAMIQGLKPNAPAAETDAWTSKPVTVAVMDVKTEGGIRSRGDQGRYLTLKLNQFFQQSALPVVERQELETLLTEMKISQSKLVDQETAVRVGRLLAARFIVTGNLTYLGDEVEVGLRVVETETGLVTASFSESFDTRKDYLPAVGAFVTRIATETLARLPPRGRVVQAEGGVATLNIGSKAGVRVGDRFNAWPEAEVKPLLKGDRVAAYVEPLTPGAALEVTDVEPEMARVRAADGSAPPTVGMMASRGRSP